jgi:hypothetical protein
VGLAVQLVPHFCLKCVSKTPEVDENPSHALDKFDDFRTSLHRRDRPLVAFGSVMFDLGGIGIVVFDPYPASPSMKPVTFFPYLLGGVG